MIGPTILRSWLFRTTTWKGLSAGPWCKSTVTGTYADTPQYYVLTLVVAPLYNLTICSRAPFGFCRFCFHFYHFLPFFIHSLLVSLIFLNTSSLHSSYLDPFSSSSFSCSFLSLLHFPTLRSRKRGVTRCGSDERQSWNIAQL